MDRQTEAINMIRKGVEMLSEHHSVKKTDDSVEAFAIDLSDALTSAEQPIAPVTDTLRTMINIWKREQF